MPAGYDIVDDAGGDAPWLVLVHGMSQDRRVFSTQIESFRTRFRIQLIDLPGHGLSADLPGPFGHREMADAVSAAIDKAGIGRCHYWGTHTGTALGLLLATADTPRFASLILEGAVLPGHAMPSVDREIQRARGTAQSEGIDAARRQWFDEAAWFDVIRGDPDRCRADAHWSIVSEFSGAPWLNTDPPQPVAPLDDRLASLDLPVLLYNGEHDLADFHAAADNLEARLPHVTRTTIADAGGFPAWEFPDRVNRTVGAFLERL